MVQHRVPDGEGLQPGMMMRAEIEGRDLLVANVAGQIFALDGRCSHMRGKLWEGKLDGHTVTCPRHGSKFDVRDGRVLGNVRIPLIGKATALSVYAVHVEDGEVFVELST